MSEIELIVFLWFFWSEQDVTKEFSHTVVDKTANSLVFVERDLMFHDKGLAYGELIGLIYDW